MNSDRELLERAAKAAGIDIPAGDHNWNMRGEAVVFIDGICHGWNPLTDDGDALRLAVKLRLLVLPAGSGVVVTVDSYGIADEATERCGADPYAATRRAIVRAAAAMAPAAIREPDAGERE